MLLNNLSAARRMGGAKRYPSCSGRRLHLTCPGLADAAAEASVSIDATPYVEKTMSMTPRKSRVLYVAAILIAIGIVGYFLASHYIQAAQMLRVRERMIDQYTATVKWIVFSVALDDDTAALAVIDRITGHRRLVVSQGNFLAFPRFSTDGERVLVIRGNQAGGNAELLSCSIENWKCRVLVRAPQPIYWPVEVRKDVVLYSGSELYAEGRRRQYDFYLAEPPNEPVRLSNFAFYNLAALNVVDDKIVFSTAASMSAANVIFPKTIDALAPARSEIFALQINWKQRRLLIPSRPLEPLCEIDGTSTEPTTSEDGTRIAFVNRRLTAGRSRYNLVVSTFDGVPLKYVDATSNGYSRPAFVGTTVLANQIFEDRYETTLVDLANSSTRQEAIFNHTSRALDALEHFEIKIAE
jgi:hypothetical protein